MYDTTQDYRITIADKTVDKIIAFTENRVFPYKINRQGILKNLRKLKSSIAEIKYIYIEPTEIKKLPQLHIIEKTADDVSSELLNADVSNLRTAKHKLAYYYAKFFRLIFRNLRSSFDKENLPESIISLKIGEILTITKHPKADRLFICKVDVGERLDIITNITGLKKGDKIPVAFVPPVEIMGIISPAQFVDIPVRDIIPIGSTIDPTDKARQEIRNSLEALIRYKP